MSWNQRCCGTETVRCISSSVRWRGMWKKWVPPSTPLLWVTRRTDSIFNTVLICRYPVVTLFPVFICCFMLYLLFLKRVQRFLFFINITAMVSCDGFGQGRGAEVSLVSFIGTWPLSAYSLPADHPLDFLSIVVHLHLRWCSLTYTGCRRGRDCSFFLAGHPDLSRAFLTWIIVTF